MDERILFRIAIGVAFIGLFTLYIIGDLPAESELNREIKLKGTIKSIYQTNKIAIIKLDHKTTSDILLFKPRKINLNENESIEITGVKDNNQIQAYRVSR